MCTAVDLYGDSSHTTLPYITVDTKGSSFAPHRVEVGLVSVWQNNFAPNKQFREGGWPRGFKAGTGRGGRQKKYSWRSALRVKKNEAY